MLVGASQGENVILLLVNYYHAVVKKALLTVFDANVSIK